DLDEAGIAQVRAAVAELDAIVVEEFARVRADATPQLTRKVDMQYIGQGHVIEIELPRLDDGAFAATLAGQFDERYAETFGYANERATPRIVAVSVAGGIGEEAFALPANDSREPVAEPATRAVYFPETSGYVDCAVYRRDLLPAGFRITGPAVVEDGQCGILLLPGDTAVVDGHRHVLAQVATAGPSS
ncbi:MAG: N-methylhydantoinase, partial [Gaiellaceae bacterium]|nr:N-methylhydantoinase [Gaiellaceae bacterium]